jgi:hypothetical protein
MENDVKPNEPRPVCGVIMPISDCDGLSHSHWADVLLIIRSAATLVGFDARLVSDTFESNLIHKEILRNVYEDEIIVCDVSGRNPNVFFELGIRMATQKPTVIIKDDRTVYPFDASPNRYIEYPRDLRHPAIEKFKKELSEAIKRTRNQGEEASFIGQLGPFQVPKIDSKEAPLSDIILQRLDQVQNFISAQSKKDLSSSMHMFAFRGGYDQGRVLVLQKYSDREIEFSAIGYPKEQIENGIDEASKRGLINLDKVPSPIVRPFYADSDERGYYVRLFSLSPMSISSVKALFKDIDEAIPF